MQVIGAAQVQEVLSMQKCIELMHEAFTALSSGAGRQIVRPLLPLEGPNVLGMMPAYYRQAGVAGVKVLSVFPHNYGRGIPSHQGQMLLFDSGTGAVKAAIDADALTAIRTAACSAAATSVLAAPEACRLAILGAGLQGRRHLEAIGLVRKLQSVKVWDLRPEAASLLAEEMGPLLGMPVQVSRSVEEACHDADIICTVTAAREPILTRAQVKPGTHINAVGACTPTSRELAGDLMAKSRVFVDWLPAAEVEAGDYLLALAEGAISADHLLGEVGQVLLGEVTGRIGRADITIFESLGQALQDLLAANYVVNVLEAEGGVG